MVIVLIDGGVIVPQGKAEADQIGIRIETGNAKHYIPHNQIKWVYEHTDPAMEKIFAQGVRGEPQIKPLSPYRPKTNDELISELYK